MKSTYTKIVMRKIRRGLSKAVKPRQAFSLADLANLVNAVQGDFHEAHFYAADSNGGNWDTIHAILGEYYSALLEDYDAIAELALQVGEELTNSTTDFQSLAVSLKDGVGYEEAMVLIMNNLGLICEAATAVNDRYGNGPDGLAIQNFLGGFLQRWTKERNYKTARRLTSAGGTMHKAQSGDDKLDYFKKKLLEHLDRLEAEGMKKSTGVIVVLAKGGKGMPPGTIREWKGKKYIKTPSGKWKPKYEQEGGRGFKMSLAAVRRAVDKAQTVDDLIKIVLDNRDRFSDIHGNPLPIIQELSAYVSKREHYITNDWKKRNAVKETERQKKRDAFLLRRQGPEKTEPVKEADIENSPVPDVTKQYLSYKFVTGNNDDININGEEIAGRWKLVEAAAPSASHDEITFAKTDGFPETAAGSTVNDRDYEHDKAAQEMVYDIARRYDSRALSLDNPIVVTQDGVVISGNNRTMSSKLAAKNGTDAGYIEALKRKAGKFGIKAEDIAYFKNPRIVFEVSHDGKYTTDDFAKFNARDTKQMSPVETAVKMSKRMKPETLRSIADELEMFDTMGELYADAKATAKLFATLEQQGLVSKFDMPQYYADNHITEAGKEFFETAMIGGVMDEGNIRNLSKEGGKAVRQALVRAIVPLIDNKDLAGYSILKELNDAVSMVIETRTSKDIRTIDDLVSQGSLVGDDRKFDAVTVGIAKKLEGTQKEFAEFMMAMSGGLKIGASGQADIFAGGAESKEDILNRFLNLKKKENQQDKEEDGKRPASLKDNIHTILHGTLEEKETLEKIHFHLADTPDFMKELEPPITGEYFTVRYGIITHHKGKDEDHNLTEEEWTELCEAIKKPFAVTTFGGGHNLFTEVKHNGKPIMVGVELKGRKTEVNAVKTAFATNSLKGNKIIYQAERLTPEQEFFIGRTNSANNLTRVTSSVSPEPGEKSSGNKNMKKGIQNVLSFLKKAQGQFVKKPVTILRNGEEVQEMRWTIRV